MQIASSIQGWVWRGGTAPEGFEFDKISDYLTEPDTLVWVDLCEPDHDTMCGLADELGLNRWEVEGAVAAAERVKATAYEAESLRDMITTIFETNLSLQDARLNMVMKKLTGWAAIIAVPTAITGFYGQNVPYPGFGTHAGFAASTGVILVLMVVLYVMFRRRDWL